MSSCVRTSIAQVKAIRKQTLKDQSSYAIEHFFFYKFGKAPDEYFFLWNSEGDLAASNKLKCIQHVMMNKQYITIFKLSYIC